MQRRRVVGLQHCAQPILGGALGEPDTIPITRDRAQLGEQWGGRAQRPPVRMLVAQRVGQDERVEGIRLRRRQPVALAGPSGDLR